MKIKIGSFVLAVILFAFSVVFGANEEPFLAAMIVMVFIGFDNA